MTTSATADRGAGKREQTKAANRAAILRAAREVFSDIGYGAASVRDIVRRTDLASGTFYNYFPDKESVLRALVDEIAVGARARVRTARAQATTARGASSPTASAPTSRSSPRTRRRSSMMRRNAGTIRTMFDEPALGAGHRRAARGPRRRHRRRARCRRTTRVSWPRRWSAPAVEVGLEMVARDTIDVDASAAFVTSVFVGAFLHMR